MQIIIESPGLDLDKKLETRVREKFENLFKIYGRFARCQVVLKKEKDDRKKNFHIEAKLSLPQRKTLYAGEQAESFEIALKKVADDLEHQLRQFKEMLEEKR